MNNKVFLVVVALIIGGGLFLAFFTNKGTQEKASQTIQGLNEAKEELSRDHVPEPSYNASTAPPMGGEHSPIWLDCNRAVYEEPVDNEKAVHGLEHGAVWITYNEQLTEEEIEILKEKLSIYTFISPYPGQTSPIVLTAWGVQLEVDSAEDSRIDTFISKYRQGPQTPEPGASCDAPDSSM